MLASRALVERLFDKRHQLIASSISPAASVHLLDALVDDFKGLRDVSAEAARARDLSRQPDIKKALSQERASDDEEAWLLGEIFELEASLRDANRRDASLIRLRDQLSRLARKASSDADSPERSLARRVLRAVTSGARERMDDPEYGGLLEHFGLQDVSLDRTPLDLIATSALRSS